MAVNQTGAGTVNVAALAAGKTVCIHEANLSLSAPGTITIQDTDATPFASWDLAATGRAILSPVQARELGRCLAAGKGLDIVNSAGNMKGLVSYSQE